MELRTSRSRSRTPFVQLTRLEQDIRLDQNKESKYQETVTEHSYTINTRSKGLSSSQSSNEVFVSSAKKENQKAGSRARLKTSDYSSEDGDNEVSSSKSELERTQLRSKKTHTVNGGVKSALQLYQEAGEYWNKFPKTDYTYSTHSKDRVELAPGVVAMPNMSRRSLRRSMEHSTSSSVTNNRTSQSAYCGSEEERRVYKRSTPIAAVRQTLFRDETESENEYHYRVEERVSMVTRIYTRVVTSFLRVVLMFWSAISIVNQRITSSFLWFGRGYYKMVSRLLLFDTWLMKSSAGGNRRIGPILAVVFLPLLLFLGWWLWPGVAQAVQGVFNSNGYFEAASMPVPDPVPKIILEEGYKDRISADDIVKLLISNPELEKIIAKHIESKTSVFQEQNNVLNTLNSEVKGVLNRIDNLDANLRLELARNSARFSSELNRCCKRQFIHLESYVKKLLADLLGFPNHNQQDILSWLHSIFVAKQDLETRLNNVTINMNANVEAMMESSANRIMDKVTEKINLMLKQRMQNIEMNQHIGMNSALSDSQVHRIVKEALAMYDADKTGLVDYALEPSGGQILSTRCTSNYNRRTAVVSVLGIPLWYPSNTPRVVITPGVVPGECWAFQNFPGYLLIQLSTFVKVSAFTLEHIPQALAPGGVRDSAPKAFTVLGLTSENDREPWEFGSYVYSLNESSIQYFAVENEAPPVNLVELRIESNHGNLNYTCLYRFRVHGILSSETT